MKLSHLDRIFIGVNTLFLFKYPLQSKLIQELIPTLRTIQPTLKVQELEQIALNEMKFVDSIDTDLSSLIC